MPGPVGGPVERQDASPFEDSIDDDVGEVVVVKDCSPLVERRLVGGEHHRPSAEVPVVHDVEEYVRCVRSRRDVADLVDDQDVRLEVGLDRVLELAAAAGGGESVDELRRGDEPRSESVLDGSVGDGCREVRLPATGLAVEDHVPAFGDEVRAEEASEERLLHGGLEREVEVLECPEDREVRSADGALDARVPALRGLFEEERSEELGVGPLFRLGTRHDVLPCAAREREVETLGEMADVDGRGIESEVGHG